MFGVSAFCLKEQPTCGKIEDVSQFLFCLLSIQLHTSYVHAFQAIFTDADNSFEVFARSYDQVSV